MDPSTLEELLAFAHTLADRSGNVILPHFRKGGDVKNKAEPGEYDPVTAADRDAESAIRHLIRTYYPSHGILGEEHGYEKGEGGSSPYTWVIDPIDGTRAFITGLPLWGTLIALRDENQPILGILDQPFTGERFVGSALGAELLQRETSSLREAQRKRTALRTRTGTELRDAVVMCTSPHLFSPPELLAFEAIRKECRLVRYGGDCYAYAMIALGCVDAVIEAGLKPYDIQALMPIVEGAGGVITTWSNERADDGGQIVASAYPALHRAILERLQPAAVLKDSRNRL